MARTIIKPYSREHTAMLDRAMLEDVTGMYLTNYGRGPLTMGDAALEGRGVPCRPDLHPIANCRNCGAAPETKHPHACGWCLTPR